jgi:hypothetical protein
VVAAVPDHEILVKLRDLLSSRKDDLFRENDFLARLQWMNAWWVLRNIESCKNETTRTPPLSA